MKTNRERFREHCEHLGLEIQEDEISVVGLVLMSEGGDVLSFSYFFAEDEEDSLATVVIVDYSIDSPVCDYTTISVDRFCELTDEYLNQICEEIESALARISQIQKQLFQEKRESETTIKSMIQTIQPEES